MTPNELNQTVEEKLRALYHLQTIDSKIDEIRILRGELPIEVQDLEDELEGLNTRIRNLEKEVTELNEKITTHQKNISAAEILIGKYSKQQDNVKNNREYEALAKEIELQKLEIELSNKRIRDANRDMDSKQRFLEESQRRADTKKRDLDVKRRELAQIIEETGREEAELMKESEKATHDIEDRLLNAYQRIRKNYRNGLAVVTVDRDSCGGCFGKIPPQRQLEIRQHKKLILCEHCGRILVDANIDEPVAIME